MPTYDYRCDGCGHTLEIFQSMSEGAKRKCPECGTLKLQRLIGAGAGIVFKGSGFYETDYRSKSYESDKAADKKAADSPAPKEESKSGSQSGSSKSGSTSGKSSQDTKNSS